MSCKFNDARRVIATGPSELSEAKSSQRGEK